jgi:hypothetical protein
MDRNKGQQYGQRAAQGPAKFTGPQFQGPGKGYHTEKQSYIGAEVDEYAGQQKPAYYAQRGQHRHQPFKLFVYSVRNFRGPS